MASYLRDLAHNTIVVAAFPSIATPVTAAATGPSAGADMIQGDGNVAVYVDIGANGSTGPATVSYQVLQTAPGGTAGDAYTAVPGASGALASAAVGTGPQFLGPFQRDGRFLKLSVTTSGTAPSYPFHGSFVEQKKQVGPTS